MASDPIARIGQQWCARRVPTFQGASDTRAKELKDKHGKPFANPHPQAGEDYDTLTLQEIFTMEPGAADKLDGLACIPSTYCEHDARVHKQQQQWGRFVALTADIDTGNHSLKDVVSRIHGIARDAAWLVYSSPHAVPGDMRWRAIIPLEREVPFEVWNDAQNALFNLLDGFGLECDRALERAGQPVYLPNVPQHHSKTGEMLREVSGKPSYYERETSGCNAPGLPLDKGPIAEAIREVKKRREADERERERIRAEAERKRMDRAASDGVSIIDEFNANNSIETLFQLYGYEQSPRHDTDWRSPYQTSGSYATRIMGEKWVSLSGSDTGHGLGEKSRSGCWGDAYDLFLHFEHGGNQTSAFRALYAERRAANPVTSTPPPRETDDPGWTEPPEGIDEDAEPVFDEPVAEHDADTFEYFSPAELEAMPPPTWLIHETISDEGLTILYGDPGSYKSFLGLDMSLRLALGMDWHGTTSKRTGVLYVAGEGARGIGKRITGWRLHHKLQSIDAPFHLLPTAVQIIDAADRAKLIRTIEQIKADHDIGLVVIDTVSRSIAGIDENSQDTMTQFVKACDEIKKAAGGALLGIHHSGKDKDRGMRGSSVLLGAVDASLKLTKSEQIVTMQTEKQKDAEQSAPVYFEMQRVAWWQDDSQDPDSEISTLVPTRACKPGDGTETISMDMIRRAFGMMTDAWIAKNPLSNKPQTKRDGRFAPAIFARQIGGDADAWGKLISAWLEGGNLAISMSDSHSKKTGLQVVDAVT